VNPGDIGRAVAVTGIGCVTAFGYGVDALWEGLIAGHAPISDVEEDLGGGPRRYNKALAPEESSVGERAKERGIAPGMRTALMSLLSAHEAWDLAKLPADLDRSRAGVMMSRALSQHAMIGRYRMTLWEKGPSAVSGLQFVQLIANSVLGRVALEFKARGPSTLIYGGTALGLAMEVLRNGEADVMLVGACDEASDYLRYVCGQFGIASTSAHSRGGTAPYDRSRDGLVPGDGAAFVVLERTAFARGRGARPLGYLKGHATVTDRIGVTNPLSRHEGDVVEALRRALGDAQLSPDEIAFMSGAGAGLMDTDEQELAAARGVFGEQMVVFSAKGALGETWGVAGVLGTIAALLALGRGCVPPTAGTRDVFDGCGVHVVTGQTLPHEGRAALALNLDMLGQDEAVVVAATP
jgi:3-oxoacyl-[acyl-carrier-protein] synthase II